MLKRIPANLASTTVYGHRVSLVVLLGLLSAPHRAAAGDAQWLANPATGNFGDATNWSGGAVPIGTATFAASTQTAITIAPAGTLSLGGITFATNAAAYSFSQSSGTLSLNGAGVVVNGGSATFNLTGSGFMNFLASSSAGRASYVVGASALLGFSDTSSSGNATITNNGGGVGWTGAATAGNATVTNNSGSLDWLGTSTAGNATVTNNGGTVIFGGNATARNARLVANAGMIDFSADAGPLGDKALTAGSIEGAGRFVLGGVQLTVGSNNLSTTVSGVISDCGVSDGCSNPSTGGSLIKVGTGTLTLTGTNTYTGGTTINGGTLAVAGDANLGSAGGGLTPRRRHFAGLGKLHLQPHDHAQRRRWHLRHQWQQRRVRRRDWRRRRPGQDRCRHADADQREFLQRQYHHQRRCARDQR